MKFPTGFSKIRVLRVYHNHGNGCYRTVCTFNRDDYITVVVAQ